MIYKTSLDSTAKIITIGTTIIIAFVILGAYFSPSKNGSIDTPIYISVFCLITYLLVFALRPISYIITDEKIIIHRLLSNIKLERKEIASANLLDKRELGFVIRIFGVGGLFGFFGKYSSGKIGSITYYATRNNRMVLLTTTKNKKIILTPNNPQQFIADMELQ